jgi:uncharacterized heparinase superfamily protein
MFKKVQLFFNTIKYLKVGQILNRIKRKFIKPKVSLFDIPKNSYPYSKIRPVIQCSQRMYGECSFKFLNKEFTLKVSEDWNAKNQDKLWLYNLHYFDDLNAINSEQRFVWHSNLIQKWIEDNPLDLGNGWEPYPSSLRIVNWIKWFLLDLNSINSVKQMWLGSLVIQIRFLSQNLEYHLLGNHLFANAKALVFAGLFFKGQEAECWYQLGVSIINRELSEQVLSDGGNFELSPMYHAIFLEDLLDLINIHQAYDRSLPVNLENKIVQMLEWLKVMSHPDGEIAFFNDSALDVAPSFVELLSYADRLGIVFKNNQVDRLIHLEKSGYIRVENENMVIIADVADIGPEYIPGHGHADALSFELSLFGKRVIVNSGISTYEMGVSRYRQRGTELHSTITIDNQNSSEVWSGFRVADRAKVFDISKLEDSNSIEFSACHDGYKKLKEGILHCRYWSVSNDSIKIVDNIIGRGVHKVRSVFPLHPRVSVSELQEDSISLNISGRIIKINFEGRGKLKIIESQYYPEFGCSVDNKHLVYDDYNGKLPSKITTRISW